jgi:hypothetical protein
MIEQSIVERLVARLASEFGDDLLGVLVGGSRVRGEVDYNSDLDVVVVIDRPRRRRWNFVIDGIEIETFINPPFQMHRYFKQDKASGRGMMPHLCSTGRVVFDPRGLMKELQATARTIWDAGPPPLSEFERWHFRYVAASWLSDLADVERTDDERAVFIIGQIVPVLIHQHYRISQRWQSAPKRVINELQRWDSAAARIARQACSSSAPLVQRTAAARELAYLVLAPLGGLMPLEWSLPWEELTPGDREKTELTHQGQ